MGLFNLFSKKAPDEGDRVLIAGRPDYTRCDNMITTSKYTWLTFFPIAISEQFRRFANLYFLCVGTIMAIGYYTDLFESAISPWTTLGPLAVVISISLLVEGLADAKRHRSDKITNNYPCVILRRSEEIDNGTDLGGSGASDQKEAQQQQRRDSTIHNGKDVTVDLSKLYYMESNPRQNPPNSTVPNAENSVKVGFQKIRRMDIRQGHFIFVKNREMVPADMILLASSGDNGSSYIETSSIDGETNLKLRSSPHLPKKMIKHLRDGIPMSQIKEEPEDEDGETGKIETIAQATKRVTRFSSLSFPDGISALDNPNYTNKSDNISEPERKRSFFKDGIKMMKDSVASPFGELGGDPSQQFNDGQVHYVAALTSEPPNPHVNTFSGKLTLPPVEENGDCLDIPLGAENILLRGAVLRNTEWAIGLACFTGTDTKLVQNSFETPSKLSRLDVLMNKTVVLVVFIMIVIISYLASQSVINTGNQFQYLW